MIRRRLGRTGLDVSLVSLGTGGPSVLGQSQGLPEAESHRLVRRALDLGINLIDSAAGYRESEVILGRALRGVPRERYVLATKFSPLQGNEAKTDPEEAARSLERSLQRLQMEYVDVFQFHGVTPATYRRVIDTFYPRGGPAARRRKDALRRHHRALLQRSPA
jgi:L-galactose dehydrogenase